MSLPKSPLKSSKTFASVLSARPSRRLPRSKRYLTCVLLLPSLCAFQAVFGGIEESLVQILTPTRRVDILRDVHHAKSQGIFSLVKIYFYLLITYLLIFLKIYKHKFQVDPIPSRFAAWTAWARAQIWRKSPFGLSKTAFALWSARAIRFARGPLSSCELTPIASMVFIPIASKFSIRAMARVS